MTRLLAVATCVALAGCASLTNTSFDNIELSRYSDLYQIAQELQKDCENSNEIRVMMPVLLAAAHSAASYSDIKASNERLATAGGILFKQSQELNTRYDTTEPTVAYCRAKVGAIATGAGVVARSISKKELKSPIEK